MAKKTKTRGEPKAEALMQAARTVLEEDDFPTTARRIFDSFCRLTGATSGYAPDSGLRITPVFPTFSTTCRSN